MGFFNSESDVQKMCSALLKRDRMLTVETTKKIDNLFNEAIALEPRLSGCVTGWKGDYSSSGMLGIRKTYRLEISYNPEYPKSVDDVIVDTPDWKLTDFVKNGKDLPESLYMVTRSVNDLHQKIQDGIDALRDSVFGLKTTSIRYIENPGGYSFVKCTFVYCEDTPRVNMWMQSSLKKVIEIDRKYFGKAPKLIKAFLAFSYLQQTCAYDEDAANMIDSDPTADIPDPWVVHPYGPLCRNHGVCQGISAAFQLFMNHFGIESHIVSGIQGDADDFGLHSWNMINMDHNWFHVDATAGILGDGIYIGSFLKCDSDMEENYQWDRDKYPPCTMRYPNYSAVERYIDDHYDDLIDSGVEEKYLIPDTINE